MAVSKIQRNVIYKIIEFKLDSKKNKIVKG